MHRATLTARRARSARPSAFARLPLAAALLAALPALAPQAAAPAAAASGVDTGKVQEVIISATKRLQPLQSTPIAVSVLSGTQLERANLNNLGSIASAVPTVNFRTNASNKDSALFIRGLGTISTSPGVEPDVSTVLDGVVTARPGQATLDLLEIERIEILRGPQGTLFGKNASAGVINIVTRAPTKELSGYGDLSYFQGNERRVRAGISGEMVPGLVRGLVSVMDGKYDGNVTNVYDGSKVNGYEHKGVRGRVDITPTKDLKLVLIADHVQADDTPPTGVPYSTNVTAYPSGAVTANPGYATAVAPVVASPGNRQINSEMLTRVHDVNEGVSAQIDWDLGAVQLTSITASRKWTNEQYQDQDRLGTLYKTFNRLADHGTLDFTQFSQELRIASARPGFVDYVAGLFYLDGKDDEVYARTTSNCPSTTAAALPNGLVPCSAGSVQSYTGVSPYGTRSKSTSVFGESTLNFSKQARGILGLRWTHDDLSYYHSRSFTPDPTNPTATSAAGTAPARAQVTGSTKQDGVSGRIGPQYNFTKDVMGYATYSRGYKGPAYNVFYNMTPTQDNVLAPEKSNAYEVGLKTTLADGKVQLNLAAFDATYSGYQANVPDLVGGVIVTRLINAGDVTTKGFEADLTARVTPRLTINGSLASTRARVKHFNCPPNAAASCNIDGKPLPFAPDTKFSLRASYTQTLSDRYTLEWGADATYTSKTNFDLTQQPDSVQPAYTIVNAMVSLESAAGWRLSLLGKNLGNRSYATFIQSSGNNINRYVPRDDRRYFGIDARYDF
ncbi:MAG: TonB-dependent receptor [Burkholderiales bacterium]|nr:TonB-dependent receptor [Burkholderiales bacterium]